MLLWLNFNLTSCNGGGSADSVISSPGGGGSGSDGISIGGFGSDGPVSDGEVIVYDNFNMECGVTKTNTDATYSLDLENSCKSPYKVKLTSGIDLVTNLPNDSTMLSLSLASGQINVSPLTTIIYYAALARADGDFAAVQDEDLELVTLWATQKFNFGIDAAGSGDFNPLSDSIDTSNAIIFVKASEGLIETTRRVTLLWTGQVTDQTIDEVLTALGEDISDGLLDGKNFADTQTPEMARLSSLWEITTATVAMEMMLNRMQITLTDNQLAQESSSVLPFGDVIAGLAAAVRAIAPALSDTSTTDIQNIQPSRLFINQAKAAAAVALDLAEQTSHNQANFLSFIAALDSMKEALNSSNDTSTPVSGIDQALLADVTNDTAAVNPYSNGNIGNSSSWDYSMALNETVATMNESTPVYNNQRHVLVEWSYPTGTSVDGFNIYGTIDGQNQLICKIANSAARSTELYPSCKITTPEPGIDITVSMTAYNDTLNIESSQSSSYSNALPQAQFTTADKLADRCSASDSLTVEFYANEETDPVGPATRQYSWDFDSDDQMDSSGAVASHSFAYADTVKMTVSDIVTDNGVQFTTSNQARLNVVCL